MKNNSKFFLLIFCSVPFILIFNMNSLCVPYIGELIILLISYLLVGFIFMYEDSKHGIDIFEPFFLSTVIMAAIFLVTPILDICQGNTTAFGIDIMPYCFKGTIIFDLSYISFTMAYFGRRLTWNRKYFCKKAIQSQQQKQEDTIYDPAHGNERLVAVTAVVVFAVSFGFAAIDQMQQGFNLEYILSFGSSSTVDRDFVGQSVRFLGLFANSLIACLLLYAVYGKSKALKIVLLIMTLAIYFVRTSRHIIIDLIVAPIVMVYIFKRKRPSLMLMVGALAVALIGSGILGYIRGSVRNGWAIDMQDFEFSYILDNAAFNLEIYKSYYGVLRAIPDRMDYTYGMQVLYTAIMIIPRIIWPNKPASYQATVIDTGLGRQAVVTGYAFPNLGEFYGDFGIIGAIVGYMIFGLLLHHWKDMYCSENKTKISIMKYSILLPACLQLIIRGAVYQNFYLILFLILPFWIVDFVFRIVKAGRFK